MLAPFKTPNLAQPNNGPLAFALDFDFTAATTVAQDITRDLEFGQVGFLQSVWIDNADNTAVFDLTLYGAPEPQRIRAQPYSQGWYPLSWPLGAARMSGSSQGGVNVKTILANYAMPYLQWAPADGAAQVPALTNHAVNALAIGAGGDAQLVAGSGGKSVKLYRGIFSVDSPTVLTFTDGPGGTVLFAAQLTAGGSLTFNGSGVNWFNTSAGNDLTLHSSAAANVYGGFGYVQS